MTQSTIPKRSVIVCGVRTSISLEEPYWQCLRELAKRRGMSVNDLCSAVANKNLDTNLSAAIRLEVFADLQEQVANMKHKPTKTKVAA